MPKLSQYQRHDALAVIAAEQQDVASRAQLAGTGFDRDAVYRNVRARRWQLFGLAVILHGGEPSERQRQWAAVLSAPRLAAIDGRAATCAYGLRGFEPDVLDLVVAPGSKPTAISGVRWHRCERFDEFQLHPSASPPRIRLARSFVDAAAWTPAARIACALLVASVQQRLVSAALLRQEILAAGPIRHRADLLAVVADIEGGADSLSEIDFVKIARRVGLPPPLQQSIRFDSSGRRRYIDADFGAFAVEVDGGLHLLTLNYWNDAHRQNDLVIGGDRILRFPSIAFRVDMPTVEAQLRRAGIAFGLIAA
ncbi:MAG TPA: hypothetical protein VN683_08550 [Acidothermaceae bacterium]|nr:hypothetical protein [Acidothermaceae bacterium]